MRISICQINPTIGDLSGNTKKIQDHILHNSDSSLLVFAELSLCGYMPYDYLFYNSLISKYPHYIKKIQNTLQVHQTVIVGSITRSAKSPALQNSIITISPTEIHTVYNKQALPEYGIFFEKRYFSQNSQTNNNLSVEENKLSQLHTFYIHNRQTHSTSNIECAFFLCYDLWHTHEHNLIKTLSQHLKKHKKTLDIIFWLSASPYTKDKHLIRTQIAAKASTLLNASLIMCNIVGAHDEIVFDGSSFAMNSDATLVYTLASAKEDHAIFDLDKTKLTHFSKKTTRETPKTSVLNTSYTYLSCQKSKEIISILELGLKDYIYKNKMPARVHLGISGGIDSALILALAVRALGCDAVTGILLPSRYTSDTSLSDAQSLAKNFNIKTSLLSIEDIFLATDTLFSASFPKAARGITQENMQARIRALLLMSYSNAHSSLLLTTGNKSEIAVGYCTLYGDMCGALNLIGDLYKTEVFDIARCINDISKQELIPESILTKEPSAELRENQKDSDSLPDYAVLDVILKQYIENRKTPQDLMVDKRYAKNISKKLMLQIWNLFIKSEHKRYQAAPIIKISHVSFGRGWIMPLVSQMNDFS